MKACRASSAPIRWPTTPAQADPTDYITCRDRQTAAPMAESCRGGFFIRWPRPRLRRRLRLSEAKRNLHFRAPVCRGGSTAKANFIPLPTETPFAPGFPSKRDEAEPQRQCGPGRSPGPERLPAYGRIFKDCRPGASFDGRGGALMNRLLPL